jgi:hypothetical protein
MAILKVLTISLSRWEDATKNAITHASKSVKNIRSVYINEHSAKVKDNKIVEYRVNAKITFEVD